MRDWMKRGRKMANLRRGRRVVRGQVGKVISRKRKGRKPPHLIRGCRVVRGWAGKVGSNAISRITLVKVAVVVSGRGDGLSAYIVKQHLTM